MIARIMWIIVVVMSVIAGFVLYVGIFRVESAVQQAALAGIACGLAVIPYVIARAFTELKADEERNLRE